MYEVVLFFPDKASLKAFQLIEDISDSSINTTGSTIEAMLNMEQVKRACEKCGAVVKIVSKL